MSSVLFSFIKQGFLQYYSAVSALCVPSGSWRSFRSDIIIQELKSTTSWAKSTTCPQDLTGAVLINVK